VHVDVPFNHHVFLRCPELIIAEPKGNRGRPPSIPVPSFPSATVKSISEDDNIPWKEAVLGTGSKGPVVGKDKCVRVVKYGTARLARTYSYIIRHLEDGSLKYASANKSDCPTFVDILKPVLLRWSIEPTFKEPKNLSQFGSLSDEKPISTGDGTFS
jgi:hypothetical protein